MPDGSGLLALLGKEEEPSHTVYSGAIESVVKDPQQIRLLIEGNAEEKTLVQLTMYSHRLAHVFRGLRSFAQKNPKSTITAKIAAEKVNLLVRTLSSLHQLLEPAQLLEILVPALDTCFTSYLRPTLRNLASVLADCDTLFEHLAADRFGSEIIRQWACSRDTSILDTGSLEAWTRMLVEMVRSCMGNHDVEEANQRWVMLLALKTSLRSVEHTISKPSGTFEDHSMLVNTRGLPTLGRMTKLSREDKKARPTGHQNIIASFALDNDDKTILKAFELRVPGSWSTLTDVIKCLEGDKTLVIFLSVLSSFPCNLCISRLSSSPHQIASGETQDESIGVFSNLRVEIVDKGIGIWQIRMSPKALKSVQHMGSHGLSGSATDKLRDLASGCWIPQLQSRAGTKLQRKKLKIPVARTQVGQRHSILWQIDIGMDGDTEVLQQDIKVWEVCESSVISKILDRVIFLQGSYSDEAVRRCCQRPFTLDGVQIPVHFENGSLSSAATTLPSADLDVRTVDPDTIEMTNKFYALTEPVIRSILANDLSAEFPFDLSKEEALVIRHFGTATLILGRSGTGKTTCLVIKLVRKYLASKAIVDERPVRQVLLTRSGFLADKLRAHTRRLIATLSSDSHRPESSQPVEQVLSMITEESIGEEDVSTLRDQSFPLICTWDHFLRLLENTTIAFDRQNFRNSDGPLDHRTTGIPGTKRPFHGQVVDGYAFQLDYWPRFAHTLTKDISASLVFAEIMGVIKGSASSRNSLAPLDRQEYLRRSCRLAPTFVLEAERSRVYDIFEMYETQKTDRGDVDYVDRVVRILQAVRRDPSLKRILRSTFDEVYIDEIQDQRCIDIELLLSFIRDGRGFHFAGDTAQAISQDSTFRFSDIKDIFFQHFSAASASANQRELARPEMFTLSKNYRSHQGILALASLVSGLIWQGFPDTVDKLEPEVGSLNGPKPVLFVGVGYNILRSSNIGHTSLSASTADFGAEQVILVRDTNTKKALQGQIGDVALVLTIPESKGMEFDDVILWNFFTDCPDQAGVRSLDTLKNEPARFDPRKHLGMCPELKHLYVAITRARVHLSIMEGSESTAASVLKVLSRDDSETLLDVTGADHEDFAVRLEMLRPGTSMDPQRWCGRATELLQQRMYKDALRCFRKAKDAKGETTAEGHLREEDGRRCNALNDIEGFARNLGAAIDLFKKAELFGDAARVLATLGRLHEAAELCFEQKMYARASPLFVEVGLYARAADCHRILEQHIQAASMLRQGSLFDQLVSYLDDYYGKLAPETLQGYNLLCKLLLKQNKVSPEYRSRAIRLLGSSDDQEKCFLEYEMDEELAELYASQQRYKDLLCLHSRKGHLERALNLAITKDLLQSNADGLEVEVLRLLDYIWAGHLQTNRLQHSTAPLKLPSGFITPNIVLRNKEWESSNCIYCSQDANEGRRFDDMQSTIAKTLLAIRNVLNTAAISQMKTFDDIPLESMQEAIRFAKDLVVNEKSENLSLLLLLTGLWRSEITQDRFLVLPWSPLRGTLTSINVADAPKVAKKWFLDGLVSTILAMDIAARELWKSKWPTRCAHFLTIGTCPRQRDREPCHWLHQPVSKQDCSQIIEDLLRMNGVFCDLAVMYYRRAMNGTFQKKYLGIKRHWLERLLREFTHLSSVEQDASTIMQTQVELVRDKRLVAISSSLEELLYFRLGKEWEQRNNFTSLLEQMQLAQAFGPNVQSRIFRALSSRLHKGQRGLLQKHLGLVNSFKQSLSCQDASTFQSTLNVFLRKLRNIDVQAFSTIHALTAVFEYLAAYLILKTCVAGCVLTQAWIDQAVLRFAGAIHSTEPLAWFQWNHKYQQCLMELTKAFCDILRRLNEVPQPGITLLCSGKTHHALLLRQRQAELVAIVVANLAITQPKGFSELWAIAKEVFEYNFVRAYYLRSPTAFEITSKLASSFLKYHGKDSLIVVIKDRKKGSPFSALENQPRVRTVAFDQICPPVATPAITHAPADMAPSTASNSPHEEYTKIETEAASKIQTFWRSCSRKIKIRRSYMELPEARAITHFISLGAACPATLTFIRATALRDVLISKGVAMSLRLAVARDTLSKLQGDAMACVEKVEISTGFFESIDDIVHRNSQMEALLKQADEKMSDACIMELVKTGVLPALEKAMKNVQNIVLEAEQGMLETRKSLDAVLCTCT